MSIYVQLSSDVAQYSTSRELVAHRGELKKKWVYVQLSPDVAQYSTSKRKDAGIIGGHYWWLTSLNVSNLASFLFSMLNCFSKTKLGIPVMIFKFKLHSAFYRKIYLYYWWLLSRWILRRTAVEMYHYLFVYFEVLNVNSVCIIIYQFLLWGVLKNLNSIIPVGESRFFSSPSFDGWPLDGDAPHVYSIFV